MSEINEVVVKEKPSSIEVSENAKGQFSFKAKIYMDEEDKETIDRIDEIYAELHRRFK